MDLFGEFQKMVIDEALCLVYQNVKYPLPQIQSSNIGEGDHSLPPLFLCPDLRIKATLNLLDDDFVKGSEIFRKFETSPLFDFDDTINDHYVLPLYWCSNEEADSFSRECYACEIQTVGTDYYFCEQCDKRYHKECVESPLQIKHPSHIKHSLQLHFSLNRLDLCVVCRKNANTLVYYCALCDAHKHAFCAPATIPFFISQPNRHDHFLTLFPRQASLTCNLCALVNKLYLTYVCSLCDFVAHSDCVYIPQTIRISRHHHRVSFIASLPLEEKGVCGVCRQKVDSDYGAYTCNVCSDYVVHTRCALRPDIWDGIDLERVPEEEEDVEPFVMIADGVILHFTHAHHLRFESNKTYDENKFCQACALPIFEVNFYACVECDFILHVSCASAPRKKFHPLHPHPLTLEVVHVDSFFHCSVCIRMTSGFGYVCPNEGCDYKLDLRCSLVSEPFEYQGHQHPLFLALDPKEKPMCHICKSTNYQKVLNCIECDFIICFECATLPYMVGYKHDKHYLAFCHGDEASDSDWCELCEGKLVIGGNKGFYKCNDCCTTLHIHCLLGIEPYLKPGQTLAFQGIEIQILRNSSLSRPICVVCHSRCPCPVMFF